MKSSFWKIGTSLFVCLVLVGLAFGMTDQANASDQYDDADGVDHSLFEALQIEFATGQEVTAACLSCHRNAGQQVMATTHWTWEYTTEDGQDLGKNNVINNYCVAISSNEPRCTSCHVGYGYKNEETFAAMGEGQVDCLVCHDQTGTYKKFPAGAGDPTYTEKAFPAGFGEPYSKQWVPADLTAIAQSVGDPTRENCGACHFTGGGGANVKHGDLDVSMYNPSFEVDVHMDAEGLNFSCQECHVTEDHDVSGSRYEMDLHGETNLKTCETCHQDKSHKMSAIDDHTDKIACQTCHIPVYAKEEFVKTWWDWSTAGELKDGEGDFEGRKVWKIAKDEDGNKIYMTPKGSFEWDKELAPEYIWFNGNTTYITLEDTFDPMSVVNINTLQGAIGDDDSVIFPVRSFGAIQPFDAGTNSLVVPNLFPTNPDTAYWKNWDWDLAIGAGQASVGIEYSGEYGWVETVMYWPLTHQVSPADDALACESCHAVDGALDFAALGYSEEMVAGLTVFPPVIPEPVVVVEETVVEEATVEETVVEETVIEDKIAVVENEVEEAEESSNNYLPFIGIGLVLVIAIYIFARMK